MDKTQWERTLFKQSLFVLATNQSIDNLEEQVALLQTYKNRNYSGLTPKG